MIIEMLETVHSTLQKCIFFIFLLLFFLLLLLFLFFFSLWQTQPPQSVTWMFQQHLAATTKASAAEQTGMHKANIRVIIHSHSNDAQHTQAPESQPEIYLMYLNAKKKIIIIIIKKKIIIIIIKKKKNNNNNNIKQTLTANRYNM